MAAFIIQDTYAIKSSPDGMWIVATIGGKEEILYRVNGQVEAQLSNGRFSWLSDDKVLWRPDSSAFYAKIEDCQPGFTCLVRYDHDIAWAQVSIGTYQSDKDAGQWRDVYLIEP
jgi:hypothetical protein